jgi:hypothetical protein
MRRLMIVGFICLLSAADARAQFGGILPRQATGVPGVYATMPFNAIGTTATPLGAFTGGPFGTTFVQGVAVGLYGSASDLEAAAMQRSLSLRQPGPRYATLWHGLKPTSSVQRFLARHPIR